MKKALFALLLLLASIEPLAKPTPEYQLAVLFSDEAVKGVI